MKKIKEHKAVVIHWDGGQPKQIGPLKKWMKDNTNGFWYHRFINGKVIDYGENTNNVVYHCGAPEYTKNAIDYFGEYCPDWNHNDKPHDNSPNNCTIGICILHDFDGGGYSEDTLLKGAGIAGKMLHYYRLGMAGLWRHSDICGEKYKKCPKTFVEHPEQWEIFKDMVNHYL